MASFRRRRPPESEDTAACDVPSPSVVLLHATAPAKPVDESDDDDDDEDEEDEG